MNCGYCGKKIEGEGTKVKYHVNVMTKDAMFHPTDECAGAFAKSQEIGLGLYVEPKEEEK